jgi:hypothetical protein
VRGDKGRCALPECATMMVLRPRNWWAGKGWLQPRSATDAYFRVGRVDLATKSIKLCMRHITGCGVARPVGYLGISGIPCSCLRPSHQLAPTAAGNRFSPRQLSSFNASWTAGAPSLNKVATERRPYPTSLSRYGAQKESAGYPGRALSRPPQEELGEPAHIVGLTARQFGYCKSFNYLYM